MRTQKEEALAAELRDAVARLVRAGELLVKSHRKCKLLGLKPSYTDEELEVFDAFTSRFARTSDILLHKVFRLIDALEYEEPGSIIDMLNRAEKRGIVASALSAKQIRELRNEIAHEYAFRDSKEIFADALALTPELLSSGEKAASYSAKLT